MKNLPKIKAFEYHFYGLCGHDLLLSILKPEMYRALFFQNGGIYSNVKNEPSAKYSETCQAQNYLVANGCILGGDIQNGILFRGIKVKPGAKVVNGILRQKTAAGKDVVLENIICDKDV